MRTVVIGGGLSGISAAIRLAERGMQVTLLEARPRLGGATYSFTRALRGAREEIVVDTGQHVLLRCYTAYRQLLRRLGTEQHVRIQERFAVPVLAPGGKRHALRRSGLPAPAHLAGALLQYGALNRTDRIRAARAAMALRRLDADDPALDARSFGWWLRDHGQTPATITRLWEPFAIAALNVTPDVASLALAVRVFRSGLLDAATAGDIGIPGVPLSTLHGEAAASTLASLGASVHTGVRVRAIEPDPAGFEVASDSGRHTADQVVLAVPHGQAADLVPAAAAPERDRWQKLGTSPIVNVHLLFAEPVTDLDFFAAIDSRIPWAFDRTAPSGLSDGQYLACSLSAADAELARPTRELIGQARDALGELLPPSRGAELRDAFVTREPRATFRGGPGSAELRPSTRTRLPGLVLAGAWTATGWPDTMEGACRSGMSAADAVLAGTHENPRKEARL